MQYSKDKDINLLIKGMVRLGWRFERGRHGKLYPPAGSGFVTVPKTPSDCRSLLNLRRDIRRLAHDMPAARRDLKEEPHATPCCMWPTALFNR